MTGKLTDEQLDVAARWWIEALKNPTFDNLGPTRGMDAKETFTNTMASVMAGMASDMNAPSEQSLARFAENLKLAIRKHEEDYKSPPYVLATDYGPDMMLGTAAVNAGIGISRFPWKTVMWFGNGGVQVACGYAASPVDLMKKQEQ